MLYFKSILKINVCFAVVRALFVHPIQDLNTGFEGLT